MILLSIALAAAATSCAVPEAEVAIQAALRYEAFDSREGRYGWRSLNDSGCVDAALSLLATYLSINGPRLTDAQRMELSFHEGQVLAFAARDSESIQYFERATNAGASPEWRSYVAATLAFLRHDASALVASRAAYAAVAPDSMRLSIIDGFIACPQEPYARAVHCKM